MSKYCYGNYVCGHEGKEMYKGNFNTLCFNCSKEKSLIEAINFNKENNLIELEGTEKQIAWANTLRVDFLKKIEKELKKEKIKAEENKKIYFTEEEEKTLIEIYNLHQEGKNLVKEIKYSEDETEINNLKNKLDSIKNKLHEINDIEKLNIIFKENIKYIESLFEIKNLNEYKEKLLTTKSAKYFIDNKDNLNSMNYLQRFFSIING